MCWFLGYVSLFFPRSWSRHLDAWWNTFLDRMEVCFDRLIGLTGPLYVLLAFTLMSGVIYLYFTIILPTTCDVLSFKWWAHSFLALILAANVFFNYFKCIFTDPGTPPDLLLDGNDSSDKSSVYCSRLLDTPGSIQWCKRCQKPKPAMAHHCNVCGRCILKMDHHCPWMNNCVGFHNYRYFFLFLWYMWIGCAYSAFMASYPLMDSQQGLNDDPPFGVLFTFVISLAVELALTLLLGWHIYMVGSAQTTIEFYGNRQRMKDAQKLGEVWENDFDLGWKKNFMSTFEVSGPYWWLLMLLPRSAPLRGDGIVFPTRDDSYNCRNIVFKDSDGLDDPPQMYLGRHRGHTYGGDASSGPNSSLSLSSQNRDSLIYDHDDENRV